MSSYNNPSTFLDGLGLPPEPDWKKLLFDLVTQLDNVHMNAEYKAVWQSYFVHNRPGYQGPSYREEFEAACKALGFNPHRL